MSQAREIIEKIEAFDRTVEGLRTDLRHLKVCFEAATKQDLLETESRLMATLADLDTEIATDLTDATAAITTSITNLEAALAAGAKPVDVQPQIDHIKAIAASIKAAADSANGVLNPPPPTPAAPKVKA
jgi:ABC-type transporter Mla subunit MlaD